MRGPIFILLLFLLGNFTQLYSQERPFSKFGKFYQDAENKVVYLALGEISFADSIVHYAPGSPKAIEKYSNPTKALGEPDYWDYQSPEYVSLGCGGQLIVEFKDNGFIDIPGDDLFFFEVGPSIEPFLVEISTDNKNWIRAGKAKGGTCSLDIARADNGRKQIYYYVRITDLRSFCPGETAGSDIDAVGTISGVFKISLNADVLFDTAKYNLKEKPLDVLEKLAQNILKIGKAEILIEGHTDSDGSVPYNISLSNNRAKSVADKLKKLLNEKGEYSYRTNGFGEANPTATNNTEEGKQKNRRVEIIVLPDLEFYKVPKRK